MKIPELLAPVGSMEHLKVAINAGASAVYLSGKNYGARKFAENFTLDEIHEAIKTAHLYNVKIYVTVNTLIKESEIDEVMNYLEKLYQFGADAVIVQDLGLMKLIREHIPDLNIFASTQTNAENQLKIDYFEKIGIKRVILPRELRKEEIKRIKTNMELEIFAHGALCYSYSGQCLLSSFKGGRSGNRGTCAQPCRQKYIINNKEDNYLSPKDLSLFSNLKEIAELNISSIKIEGRMRSKEYLAIVISNYRKALNKLKSNKEVKTEELDLVFNRGLTTGQFKNKAEKSLKSGHIGLKIGKVYEILKNQIAIKLNDDLKTIPEKGDGLLFLKNNESYGLEISRDTLVTTLNHYKKGKNKALKDLNRKDRILLVKRVRENKKIPFDLTSSTVYLSKRNKISKKTKEIELNGSSFIKSKLTLTFSVKNNYPLLKGTLRLPNNKIIKAESAGNKEFETPLKKVLDSKTIKKQLGKIGNYPFTIEHINVNYKDNLFLPVREINQLRRNLLNLLEDNVYSLYENRDFKLNYKKDIKNEKNKSETTYSYYTNNLEHLKHITEFERVYLEIPPNSPQININYMVSFLKEAIEISKGKNYKLIWKWPDIAHDKIIQALFKVKGILSKLNYSIDIMSPHFNGKYAPYSMNVSNTVTVNALKEEGYEIITLSVELSKEDYESIKENLDSIEVYVHGNIELLKSRYKLFNCEKIKDKKGNEYLIKNNISGEEIILINNEIYSILNEINYLKSLDYTNFSIDGRWKDLTYLNEVISFIKEEKTPTNFTKGNF